MIKTYLYKNPEDITAQQLEREMLPVLPAWRREQTLKFRFHLGRVLCAQSYLLLQKGLEQDFNISASVTFDYLGHGKPIIREYPDVHFNISHCKNGILCVISDEGPVGCDIEMVEHKISDALLERCCCSKEIEAVKNAHNPECEFVKLWTKKEAVVKFTGEGLNDQLPELLLQDWVKKLNLQTAVCEADGFVYTVCSGGTDCR